MTSDQIALIGYTIHTGWFFLFAGIMLALWFRHYKPEHLALLPWCLLMGTGFAIASGRLLTWIPRAEGLEWFRLIFLVAGVYAMGWTALYLCLEWQRGRRFKITQ